MHTVGIPPARGLQNDQVFAMATLTLPSVGPMSHPSPALPGWCEPEGGTLLGGGGLPGHWGSVYPGQAATVQQTGSGLGPAR